MRLGDAIQRLTELQQQHGPDIDVAFEIEQASDPDAPLGNDFASLDVLKDSDGHYAVFVTRPYNAA